MQAKVRAKVDKMKQDLDSVADEVCREMKGMTASQQNEVVTFWSLASDFFADVISWMSKMFQNALEVIKAGFRLAKDLLVGIFNTVKGYLKEIF